VVADKKRHCQAKKQEYSDTFFQGCRIKKVFKVNVNEYEIQVKSSPGIAIFTLKNFKDMRTCIFLTIFILAFSASALCQDINLQRVEPPFWWKGFKNQQLQLLVYGKDIGKTSVTLKYPGVTLEKVHRAESQNYLFLDLKIQSSAKPGSFTIGFSQNGTEVASYRYQLLARDKNSSQRKGFDASDVIYLLMPDRFANGDPSNDNAEGMLEKVNRSDPNGRHGGDLKGILSHLDYIKELGMTAVWLNPVLENNQEVYSYHGYSTTDYYKVDPRFGTNSDYVALNKAIHDKGMKVIMDMVFNHCGSGHWWMNDLPMKDWLNQFPEYTQTSFRAGTVTDPHGSVYDRDKYVRGWFVETMPDLNQHNPFMARYLIQNSIWWIEYAGLDGIRQDTYPYCFKDFMAEWVREVLEEYPDFNIVGESMLGIPAMVAYWQKGALNRDGYNSNLPSLIDFPLADALKVAFMEKDAWATGIIKLYDVLSQDYLYGDPMNLMVIADNHDINRFLDFQDNDIRKLKMAMAFILTTRGIPQVYYGTEILMTTGADKGDGMKRKDFPGGWPGDPVNAFDSRNRDAEQNAMHEFMKTLVNWRNTKPVIHNGKLMQFLPVDGVYTYFRYNETDTVMVVMNNHESESKPLDLKVYAEMVKGFYSGVEVISGSLLNDLSVLQIPPKSVAVIEFRNKKK